jgi:short subunit dehydrogenase-like uncharacterized protein
MSARPETPKERRQRERFLRRANRQIERGDIKGGPTTTLAEKIKERLKKRKATRTLRKEYGKKKREGAKKIREGDLKGKNRRVALGANRVFHKVDKEGKVGGFAAFGKYAGKLTARVRKRNERKAAVQARRDERKANR